MFRPELTPEVLNQRGGGYLPHLIGIEIIKITADSLTARLPIRSDLLAPNGYLHAAAVVALADTAAGYGTIVNLPEGASSFTTIELKSNFLGTARDGVILCTATPAHLGRTTQVWDAVVRSEGAARPLALFRCTQLILYPR